jgi:cellulose synthase (UDP-forming)
MNKIEVIKGYKPISQFLMLTMSTISIVYILWWLDYRNAGNIYLYTLLVIGEIYHVFQVLGYLFTVYSAKKYIPDLTEVDYPVDIFITVCGEPVEIVEKTLEAALALNYKNFHVYILNDGYVANKHNWKEIDALAQEYGAIPITRITPGGFKAGNINNALKQTQSPFIVIFDADHVPHPDFLKRTMGHFVDKNLALLQTPQFYENQDDSELTKTSWEQQELFFGPICIGKSALNSAFWCGTNAIVRREALEEIGGVPENNIAEDFLASMLMHEKGWKSVYVPEILSRGLAPLNLKDYITQQFRWARGSLEMIFVYNPVFRKGLSFMQKFQYLWSASYYLGGLIILIDALIPVVSLIFDILPVNANTTDFLVYFFPFITTTLYILITSSRGQITYKAVQLSAASFYVYLLATFSTIFKAKVSFKVTPKSSEIGNYLVYAIPHMLYLAVGSFAISLGIYRHGFTPSVLNNISWTIFNMVFFTAYLKLAYPWENIKLWLFGTPKVPAISDYLEYASEKSLIDKEMTNI